MQPDSVTGFVWYSKKAISAHFKLDCHFFPTFLFLCYAIDSTFLYHSIVLNYVCLTFITFNVFLWPVPVGERCTNL